MCKNSRRQIVLANSIDSRNGRTCAVHQPLKSASCRMKSLVHNSFPIRAVQVFNVLPIKVRNIKNCDVDTFKSALDEFLKNIPDEPPTPGYSSVSESNSLIHQAPLVKRTCATKTDAGSYSSAAFR